MNLLLISQTPYAYFSSRKGREGRSAVKPQPNFSRSSLRNQRFLGMLSSLLPSGRVGEGGSNWFAAKAHQRAQKGRRLNFDLLCSLGSFAATHLPVLSCGTLSTLHSCTKYFSRSEHALTDGSAEVDSGVTFFGSFFAPFAIVA